MAGRVQELYETAVTPLDRDIEYLSADGGTEFEELIQLSWQVLAVATGDSNIFDRLEHRLSLAAAENALISNNNRILNQLLFEIDSLAADVQGQPQPAMAPGAVTVETGVTDEEIRFGQSAALKDPAAASGEGMQLGILAAFNEANQPGGINARQLTLRTLNDDYETIFACANTQLLIENDRVFGLIGAVGTPTTRAALPLVEDAGVPFVGAFTGAQLLRRGDQTNVLNVRASYHDETARMIELLGDAGVTKVAVLYQNDSYGQDGLAGAEKVLDNRDGRSLVSSWYYPRNTTAVTAAAYRIATAEPEAVVIIGAYAPTAEFTKQLHPRLVDDPIFLAVSFVDSNALKDRLIELGQSVADRYVTQMVPLPSDQSNEVVTAYHAAQAAYDSGAEPGFISLEGYPAGRLAVERLKTCKATLPGSAFSMSSMHPRPSTLTPSNSDTDPPTAKGQVMSS